MTVQEAIDAIDALKPNQYQEEVKIKWLSDLDTLIFRDVILTHEHPTDLKAFEPYSASDKGRTLIAPAPYDEVYTAYLRMKIDESNGETTRYNNSVTLYNAYYDNFAKYWNKNHMPISKGQFRWW